MAYTLKNEITVLYLFYRELSTQTLLNILNEHSRERDCRKSYLAICYALRKRGIIASIEQTCCYAHWQNEVRRNKRWLDEHYA